MRGPTTTNNFYAELAGFADFREFSRVENYVPLPEDWLVVVTDVQNSTRAIENGQYKDVNAVGVASIVALLNAITPLRIPYVFGGDGATLCVPQALKEKIQTALIGTKQMAEKSFGLSLRTGIVDMKTITAAGRAIFVGKFQPNPHYEQAMLAGDGLELAELLVKNPAPSNPHIVWDLGKVPAADFSGFECRWNEVPSPHGETIAVLVKALPPDRTKAHAIYEKIIQGVVASYGDEERFHPLRLDGLMLAASPRALSTEVGIKTAFASFGKRVKEILTIATYAIVGRWLMWKGVKTETADWGRYKQNLINNTDFRKFDGALRMVIAGTADQRRQLREFLEERRRAGEIVFGLHVNPSAIITCLITNYGQNHVHFIDGSAGGYALAAKELKAQMFDMIGAPPQSHLS